MRDAGKSEMPAISANAVVQDKVTTINADLDAVPEKGYDSVTGHS
jgi:hypothetical protein